MSHADILIMNVQEEQGSAPHQVRLVAVNPRVLSAPSLLSFLTPQEMFTQMGKVESWGQGSCHEAF